MDILRIFLWLVILAALGVCAYKDATARIIPDKALVVILLAWSVATLEPLHGVQADAVYQGLSCIEMGLRYMLGVCVCVGLLCMSWGYERYTGRFSMGGGDVKLLAVSAVLLGLYGWLGATICACAMGALWGWWRGSVQGMVALGPSIVVTTVGFLVTSGI